MKRAPSGFSLVELMIASAIVLLIFAGATWAAVTLHKRGNFEEAVADLQDVARGSRELVAPRIERAGAGLAGIPLTVGDVGGSPDVRLSVGVRSNATLPPVPYAALTSDEIDLHWTEPSSKMDVVVPCGASASARDGNDVCVQRLPSGVPGDPAFVQAGDLVALVNGSVTDPAACLFRVTTVTPGAPSRLTLDGASFAGNAPAPSLCPGASLPFFGGGMYVVKVGGATFRIAWSGGADPMPTLQYDPDGSFGPQAAQPVAQNVERLQARVGLVSQDLLNPNPVPASAPLNPPPIIWFPDLTAATPRPAIDNCLTAVPACDLGVAAGVNADPNLPDALNAIDTRLANAMGAQLPRFKLRAQLMRRARMIELDLTVRSARKDLSLIRTVGPGFGVDGVGNPLDGRSRRHYEMRVSLRNFNES